MLPPIGERAMKLLDAGEVLPDAMILDLVAAKLASMECQQKGWVLEGVGTSGGVEELEEAIVMATEVKIFVMGVILASSSTNTNGHSDGTTNYFGVELFSGTWKLSF